MKIYDISREVFSTRVYPGDMVPYFSRVKRIGEGSECNLTDFTMCAHNATHIDAPFHFLRNGKTIENIDLTACIGEAEVIEYSDRKKIKETAAKRILLKNCNEIEIEVAKIFVENKPLLLGVDSQSVGDANIHRMLLSTGIVLLEGLNLTEVIPGNYTLYAPPVKLAGADGAPCRAVLLS